MSDRIQTVSAVNDALDLATSAAPAAAELLLTTIKGQKKERREGVPSFESHGKKPS